jgi:hypothetical protein
MVCGIHNKDYSVFDALKRNISDHIFYEETILRKAVVADSKSVFGVLKREK